MRAQRSQRLEQRRVEVDFLHIDQDIGLHHTQGLQIEWPRRQHLATRCRWRPRAGSDRRTEIDQIQTRAAEPT